MFIMISLLKMCRNIFLNLKSQILIDFWRSVALSSWIQAEAWTWLHANKFEGKTSPQILILFKTKTQWEYIIFFLSGKNEQYWEI